MAELWFHVEVPDECAACGRAHVRGEDFTVLPPLASGYQPTQVSVPWAHEACLN